MSDNNRINNGPSFGIEGVTGGDLFLRPFVTGTGQARVSVQTAEASGILHPVVTLDEAGVHALITSLVGALGDARVTAWAQAYDAEAGTR